MAVEKPPSAEPERFEPTDLAGLSPELGRRRLPAGRHRLPRSLVLRNQRLRIVAAMLQVLPRHGYAGTTIGHLTGEAGVSRAAFYEQFEGKEECFIATYDLAVSWLCERIEGAAAEAGEWPERIRAATERALSLLAANPELAHLVAIDVLHAGSAARQRQQECLAGCAEALRAGRGERSDLPLGLEEMLLGGVVATIGRYVDAGRPERLVQAAPELVQYLLVPYMDPEEVQRVLAA